MPATMSLHDWVCNEILTNKDLKPIDLKIISATIDREG